jgi:hypothetical protein
MSPSWRLLIVQDREIVQARDRAQAGLGCLSSTLITYFPCGAAMPDFALRSILNAISTQFSPA